MKQLTVLLCLAAIFLVGCSSSATEKVDEYMQFKSKIGYEIHSNLTLFPKQRPEPVKSEQYYYSFDDTFLDKGVQIYYDCTYLSKEAYLKEKERLASEKNTYSGGGTAVYDTENFQYPAYVIKVGSDSTSEYALLIENENRIVYIYVQYAVVAMIHFDTVFLPKGYMGNGDCDASYSV